MQMKPFVFAGLLALAGSAMAEEDNQMLSGMISTIDWSNARLEIEEQWFRINRSTDVAGLDDRPVSVDRLEPGMLIKYSLSKTSDQSRTPSIDQIHVIPK